MRFKEKVNISLPGATRENGSLKNVKYNPFSDLNIFSKHDRNEDMEEKGHQKTCLLPLLPDIKITPDPEVDSDTFKSLQRDHHNI